MEETAQNYVLLNELQQRAGDYIAELTRNEACYICGGSSSGLLLSAAACMTGNNPKKIRQLPDTTGMKNEFLVHRSHMNPYARVISVSGAKLREVGYAVCVNRMQFEGEINEHTAGIFYFFYRGGWRMEDAALTPRRNHRDRAPPRSTGGSGCRGTTAPKGKPLEVHPDGC